LQKSLYHKCVLINYNYKIKDYNRLFTCCRIHISQSCWVTSCCHCWIWNNNT